MSKLELDSVTLYYGMRMILQDVYLKCETGEVVGMLGRNGCGKSSLMKILFGSLKGESQSVRIDGQYVSRLYEQKNAISFMPQEGFAMNYLSFDQMANIFCTADAKKQCLEIREIRQHQHERIGNLSTGVRKLVEVLVMLYSNSKFVILDEPFSFLSPVLTETVISHIRKQAATKGIFLTDHLFKSVFEVCTRNYLLYNGSLRQITDKSQLEDFGYVLN